VSAVIYALSCIALVSFVVAAGLIARYYHGLNMRADREWKRHKAALGGQAEEDWQEFESDYKSKFESSYHRYEPRNLVHDGE